MYEYLNQHPLVLRSRRRETHFFDWRWQPRLTAPSEQVRSQLLDVQSLPNLKLDLKLKREPQCYLSASRRRETHFVGWRWQPQLTSPPEQVRVCMARCNWTES
jgi:hypothetical protein